MTPLKRIWLSLGILVFVCIAGTIGYMVLEGWPALQALYMTVITISTVGYREVGQLSADGRVFTIVLILVGIGTVGYGLGNVAAFIVEGEFSQVFRWKKMERNMAKLCHHIIICGYGDEGRHAADELTRSKVPFVIVERDGEICSHLIEQGFFLVHGDATHDDVLEKAKVHAARGLIAALPEDSDNVFVALSARGLNPNLTIVARANDEASAAKLHRAGADHVISSARIGGRRMASALLRPKVVNFLDVMMRDHNFSLRLEEIDIGEKSPLAGQSIRDLHIRRRTGTLVIGYQTEGKPMQVNPPAETVLKAGDVIIVLGNDEQVEALRQFAQPGG